VAQLVREPPRKGNSQPLHERQCLRGTAGGKRENDWHWLDAGPASGERVVGQERFRGGHIVDRLGDEETAARLSLGEDALVLVAGARVALGDGDSAKHMRWCMLSG
jgi:hypothetical protein